MTELIVCETFIRQDEDGRYCLNDLHRAAGGAAKHKPALFLRRGETKGMEREIKGTESHLSPVLTVKGQAGGTYVAKELVYAYGMWISPAFALKVIRTYDAVMQSHIDKLNSLSARRARADLELLEAQRDASRCGLGLRRWRDDKPALEARIHALQVEMQPGLFLN